MIRIEVRKELLFIVAGIVLMASAFEYTGFLGWCFGALLVGFGVGFS